jgi:hypothetical protein
MVVKTINVELAPAVAAPEVTIPTMAAQVYVPQPNPMAEEISRQQAEANAQAAFQRRYFGGGQQAPGGIAYRGIQAPQQTYAPQPGVAPGAQPPKGGLPTVLDEKLLKITIALYIVKPLPLK